MATREEGLFAAEALENNVIPRCPYIKAWRSARFTFRVVMVCIRRSDDERGTCMRRSATLMFVCGLGVFVFLVAVVLVRSILHR
jgi:hypothetical protein